MLFEFIGMLAGKSLLKSVNQCAIAFDEYQQSAYECAEALVEYEKNTQTSDTHE